jgi:hypothetical protein
MFDEALRKSMRSKNRIRNMNIVIAALILLGVLFFYALLVILL